MAYALANFRATGVFDENDELLATSSTQLHPGNYPVWSVETMKALAVLREARV